MASILDVLNTNLGKELINKASKETGESKDHVASALGMVLPLILGNFKNKMQEGHDEALTEMLEEAPDPFKFMKVFPDKKTGDLVDCGNDYGEIIIGENFSNISKTISESLRIEESAVHKISVISIPVIVAILSIQKKKENLKNNDIESLIDNALGNSSKYNNSFLETIQSFNEDPNIIPNPSEMILGQGNKKDSILKGYTGGK